MRHAFQRTFAASLQENRVADIQQALHQRHHLAFLQHGFAACDFYQPAIGTQLFHFFDYFFGTTCGKTSLAPLGPKSAGPATNLKPTGGLLPTLPKIQLNMSLPCTVGDLVDSVLGQRSGCDGR